MRVCSDRTLTPLPVRIAQLALEQLAARVAGHFRDEVHRPRPLHLGQAALERADQLSGKLGAWRHPLGRVDVRATRDDHVSLAVTQIKEPLVVDETHVADGEEVIQPVRPGFLRITLIDEFAYHHFQVNGAGRSRAAVTTVVADDSDFAYRPWLADRAWMRQPVVRGDDRTAA